MKLEFSGQIFEKYTDISFHENTLSGNRVVPCEQTGTKLIVAFRNFAKGPNKDLSHASESTARVLYKNQSFSAV